MTFPNLTDLAAFLGVDPASPRLSEALTLAKDLVAEEIGAESLGERKIETTVVPDRCVTLLLLPDGPATSLESAEIDGDALDDAELYGSWAIRRPGKQWAAGVPVAVVYTAGWATGALPSRVRQAILVAAATLHGRPDLSVTSERYVSASANYGAGLPAHVGDLVSVWRRPPLL